MPTNQIGCPQPQLGQVGPPLGSQDRAGDRLSDGLGINVI
jgi:hypothetical protein